MYPQPSDPWIHFLVLVFKAQIRFSSALSHPPRHTTAPPLHSPRIQSSQAKALERKTICPQRPTLPSQLPFTQTRRHAHTHRPPCPSPLPPADTRSNGVCWPLTRRLPWKISLQVAQGLVGLKILTPYNFRHWLWIHALACVVVPPLSGRTASDIIPVFRVHVGRDCFSRVWRVFGKTVLFMFSFFCVCVRKKWLSKSSQIL